MRDELEIYVAVLVVGLKTVLGYQFSLTRHKQSHFQVLLITTELKCQMYLHFALGSSQACEGEDNSEEQQNSSCP